MHPPLSDATKSFWEAVHAFRKKGYGHWLILPGTQTPRPELVDKDYKFVRVPCEEYHLSVWAFRDPTKSVQFQKAYGGLRWLSATR